MTETLAWTPKNLVASLTQSPVNVDHLAFQYDGAGRLTRRQRSNPPSSPTVTMRGLDSHGFDSAENLLVHTEQSSCAATAETTSFPLDASGRNRPSKSGSDLFEWDSAGNLVRRGNQRYQYDYRNRLTLVTDLTGLEEIARYEYDAFNRRLKKTVGGVVTETVWDGWEPVEEYRDGQLQSRRLFGPELGELVRLEQDLDGNGTLEQTYLPVFDSLGHLAELRREDGSLVERYTYTPFGERRVFLPDTTPPRIEQVLAMPLEIRLEVSEEVDLAKLRDAIDTGISLRSQVTGLYFDVTIDQPPTDGCKPGRRLVLRKASTNPEDPWPEPAEPVELYFAGDLLTDRAGNTQPAALSKIFPWPTQPAVIQDDVAPRVTTLVVEPAGTVLITFSEPPSLARLASVARINGAAVSWTPLPEGYSVRSARLAEGNYTLTLSTAELDLADLGLIEPYALSFEVDGERHILKEELPEGQVAASTAGNGIGFHGLGIDEETGLMFARNRYYDPEMGRFVTMDPLGYVDGPNGYQYGMNSPGNYSDRLGLSSRSEIDDLTMRFTWHLGWIDRHHTDNPHPTLAAAWELLRDATPGQTVDFVLEMAQGGPGKWHSGLTHKKSSVRFSVLAGRTKEERRGQLYHAFQVLSESFESRQGQGLQQSEFLTAVFGWFKLEWEKTPSSFSAEDLTSNALSFIRVVDGVEIDQQIAATGWMLPRAEEVEFSMLVWDYLLKPRPGGGRSWNPVLLTDSTVPTIEEAMRTDRIFSRFGRIPPARSRKQVEAELLRLRELMGKYHGRFGPPKAPGLPIPVTEGVSVVTSI